MTTKTITIKEEVYHKLVALKTAEESFSDEIERILERKRDIMDFWGVWKDMSEEETMQLKQEINKTTAHNPNNVSHKTHCVLQIDKR